MFASSTAPRLPIGGILQLILIATNQLYLCHTQTACPEGYVPHENGTCQPNQQLRCPPDTVFMNEKCRKILCPSGELYNGICLQAACPAGLVWRGKRCQEPGYVTTIVEIENVLTNEIHEDPMYYTKSVLNEFTVDNSTLATTILNPPANIIRPSDVRPTRPTTGNGCCTIRTPRICKRYDQKWICFNRSQKLCDARVCVTPIVYLKAPEIKYSYPLLTMPPNPAAYHNCVGGSNCHQNETTLPDCSGCATNHPENCSRYCYSYMCPFETCSYMDLDLYCSYYPAQFGCIKEDGCLWNWC